MKEETVLLPKEKEKKKKQQTGSFLSSFSLSFLPSFIFLFPVDILSPVTRPACEASGWPFLHLALSRRPQLHTIHTYTSLCRSNSPACPSMTAARCFVEEGFVTLINVPLLHSSEETLLRRQTRSCLYSSKSEDSNLSPVSGTHLASRNINKFHWICWNLGV